ISPNPSTSSNSSTSPRSPSSPRSYASLLTLQLVSREPVRMRAAAQTKRQLDGRNSALLHPLRIDDHELGCHLGIIAGNAEHVTVAFFGAALARDEARFLEALHRPDEERALRAAAEIETLVAVRNPAR